MVDNKLSLKGFVVWGTCALFFLYEFFLRTVLGTYQHPIMMDLHLNTFEFSLLSTTIFLLIYGLMQVPVGLIVDKIGLKKSLLIGTVVCTISSFGFAYTDSFPIALLFRMLMGFGASFGFICLLMSVHEWMPHKYSAIFIGLSNFIGTMGPMLAAGPLHSLSGSSGVSWRSIFLLMGFVGVGLTLASAIYVENNIKTKGHFRILYQPASISTSLKTLFKRTQPILLALVSMCLYFSIEYLSENEGRAFLLEKDISAKVASYMLTIAWLGYAFGCPILGVISDIIEKRKSVIVATSFIAILSTAIILYVSHPLCLQFAFFMLGISASGVSICFAMMREQFKRQFVAVGFGLNNAVICVISSINAPLIGYSLEHVRTGELLTLHEYQSVFIALIVLAVVSAITSIFFIKETFCKSQVDYEYLSIRER